MQKDKWTTQDVPGMNGKVIVITGGYSGLGLEAARVFAGKGAIVVMAGRSVEKGESARQKIGSEGDKIEVMYLDLADLSSVRDFSAAFQEKFDRLDVLLNNAGIMATPWFLTKDGLEGQNGTNHYGHFALTGLLIDRILHTPGSRVVNVSSLAHKLGKMDFDNPLYAGGRGYSPTGSYARSKLSNLLFTYELQRRFEKHDAQSISVAAHPGVSATNLERYVRDKLIYRMMKPLLPLIHQDAAQGTLPEIRASADPQVKGGDYYGPSGFAEMKGDPVPVRSSGASRHTENARKLWELSEKLTGVSYL